MFDRVPCVLVWVRAEGNCVIDRKEHEFASTSNATCESAAESVFITVTEIILKKLFFVVW